MIVKYKIGLEFIDDKSGAQLSVSDYVLSFNINGGIQGIIYYVTDSSTQAERRVDQKFIDRCLENYGQVPNEEPPIIEPFILPRIIAEVGDIVIVDCEVVRVSDITINRDNFMLYNVRYTIEYWFAGKRQADSYSEHKLKKLLMSQTEKLNKKLKRLKEHNVTERQAILEEYNSRVKEEFKTSASGIDVMLSGYVEADVTIDPNDKFPFHKIPAYKAKSGKTEIMRFEWR